tara:strand:+ start:3596 stop:4636 length:1041 start_codon:yes stop_codon:yes gene_type:complete
MATYTPFTTGDTVDSIDRVFTSAWSGISPNNDLGASHFSSSTQYVTTAATSSGAFFMDIYSTDPDNNTDAEVQYSIAYGNKMGSGSLVFSSGTGGEGFSAAKSIYGQYRNLVFGGDETQNFSFDGHTPDGIYIININRARYKNAIRTGNLFLKIGNLELTDDSITTSGSANAIRAGVGREFNLVSGSNGVRFGSSNTYVTDSGSYGYVYPDAGFIILNQDALDALEASNGTALATTGTSTDGRNPVKLQDKLVTGASFILDAQEDIASKYYFVRAKNQEFNYTTNDSFTEDDGTLKFDSMIDNPETYITTIGLYNDNQDLLAVAKLSQPLPKDFTKESLIKVKLDY